MRISVSKKIMGMVLLPIVLICVVVGIVCGTIMNNNITSEIEKQLHVSAYNFKTDYELTLGEGMDKLIQEFKAENDIDVTIFEDNVRTISTVDGAVGTTMDDGILSSIRYGDAYFATDANVNGEAYYGYYIPIMKDGKYIGASFTGIPQADANETITNGIIKIVVWVIGCGVVAGAIAFVLVRKMVKSIKGLENTIGTLLQNDLATKHSKYEIEHDEIEEICNKTVDFSTQLKQIVTKFKDSANGLKEIASGLKEATETTTDSSNQIAIAIEEVAHGAVKQTEELTSASHKVEEISCELSHIKDDVNVLHSITNLVNSAKVDAVKTLAELQNVNSIMSKDIGSTNNQVSITNESVQRIKEAVELIEDVTAQTKLLSLNASIEAAHAGEHGKGFAVVAEEIGKLASQSAKSSDEIKHILDDLSKNYSLIVENVKNTTNNMNIQNDKLGETKQVFDTLENNIDETVKKISNINAMVDNTNREIKTMVDTITNLSAISQENSASTEEINAAIEEMKATIELVYEKALNVDKSADMLMNEIKVFKTE